MELNHRHSDFQSDTLPTELFGDMLFLLKLLDYNIILINLFIIAIIASVLFILNFIIRQKNNNWEINTQKYAAYECGFEPFSETQSQVFEIQFFLVSIMFLIFDVELALMFPWAVYFSFLTQAGFWVMILFVILLTIGFFYEWKKGALNWNNAKPTGNLFFFLIISAKSLDFEFLSFLDFFFVIEHFFGLYILVLIVLGVMLKHIWKLPAILIRYSEFASFAIFILFFFYGLDLFFYKSTFFLFHNYFIVDLYTQFAKFIVSFCMLCILLFWSKNYIYYHKYIIWEFPLLLLLAGWFIMLLLSSFNLFSLFISLEGLSLCLYVLAAYDFDRRSSAEAALKYFTLGTLSSGFLLLGIVFIYISVGSLDYFEIFILTNDIVPQPLIRIGSCLIFFSFIFKLGAWPCHQWVPDVYQGAPTIVTVFFATAVKSTIFFSMVRLFNFIAIEKPLLAVVCMMSLVVGILGALKTDKIKRFFAYAAINQMGFILLGIFVYAIDATLIYFVLYILTSLMFFMIILKTKSLTKQTTTEITFLSDLKFLSFYNSKIAVYLLIILFSMAGLPPFLTSLTKWYILLILATNHYILLLAITVILTIFSIYYYIRLIKTIFFEPLQIKNKNKITFYFGVNKLENIFLFVLAVLLIGGPVLIDFNKIITFFNLLQTICVANFILIMKCELYINY